MYLAATLPALMASMMVPPPLTASPPTNTPGLVVLSVYGIDLHVAPLVELDLLIPFEGVKIWLLSYRGDDAAGGEHERGHVGGDRSAPAAGIGLPEFHLLADQSLDAIHALALHRRGQVQEFDAFFFRLFDLPGVGRHLVPRPAVDHLHLFRAQTDRGTGRVHGGVTAAQHQHGVADIDLLAQRHLPQEHDGVHGTRKVFSRDAQRPPHVSADADEGGFEPLFLQVGELDVATQTGVVADLDALLLDELRLAADHVAGQPVLGDAHVHHAARHGQVFEDGGRVAHAGQEVGGGEAGRTGADDGHLLAGRACRGAAVAVAPADAAGDPSGQ